MSAISKLFDLTGRRALVTGGGKGLGLVIANALADAGAEVAVCARTGADVEAAARAIAQRTGRRALALTADVTLEADVRRMVDQAQSGLGEIDILVNNAGINVRGPAHELAESDYDAVIAVNLKAPFLCSRILGPQMCKRGWGRIINLGSILSAIGLPDRAPYASAKSGVMGLTRVLAMEYAASGVTVNALCPGPFATEMNRPLLNDPEKYKAFVSRIPLGRWGELPEIIVPAVFLASDASSYMTGAALYVDGGWTAQ